MIYRFVSLVKQIELNWAGQKSKLRLKQKKMKYKISDKISGVWAISQEINV